MIPNMAPLSSGASRIILSVRCLLIFGYSDVSFVELGRRFDLNPGSIQSAVARACAEAAMRSLPAPAGGTASTERAVQQKDFLNAGEAELSKVRAPLYFLVTQLQLIFFSFEVEISTSCVNCLRDIVVVNEVT